MKKNSIITITSILLFTFGILNLLRLFYGWEITLNKSEIPIWTSLICAIISMFLSYNLLKIR